MEMSPTKLGETKNCRGILGKSTLLISLVVNVDPFAKLA